MDQFMQQVITEAQTSLADGNYPFGAVLVKEGNIIGIGRNRMNTNDDPTSHAEIEVLRAAGLQESYVNSVMYASAFPCIMCAGAIVHLGVPEIVVGATWDGCETSRAFLESNGVKLRILELEECKELLKQFRE